MTDKKWTVRRSTYDFSTPWFSVRSDYCVDSSGIEKAPYYALEMPDFVHVLATTGDQVVLVRQYRHAFGAWSLELPGGLVEQDDSDVVAAGARELKEETGYQSGCLSYIMALSIDPARYTNRLHLVRADEVIAGAAAPEPTEQIETVLLPVREVKTLVRTGQVVNAAHAAMLLIGLNDD